METERNVWEKWQHDLTCYINVESSDRHHPPLKALASARALIVNHSTSDETISHLIEILVRSLQHDQEPLHHHVLKLLCDLALHYDLSQVIFDTIHAYASVRKDASHLTAKAVAVLVTTARHRQSFSTSSSSYELSECFFLLLCSSPYASVRSWILFNANSFDVRPCHVVTVLLNFTSDPYPFVRRAALDGLMSSRDLTNLKTCGLIQSCYDRAVELLLDTNECVRSAAVHVVSEWGHMLATLDNEVGNQDWLDAVFIQLCSKIRDMSVEVRTGAFIALGNTKLVSEEILLQTLSKKITKVIKERKITGLCTSKEFELPASNVAGVFVHGLEDEFSEVRKSACMSLGKLTMLSLQFAEAALNLLMDMLNDDIMAVRLQCLQTMHHMATSDCLKVQQTHMHMFLGTLVDSNTLIRHATRKILRLMKLGDMAILKSVTNGLLANLESYPEDENDIFNVLFNIGRSQSIFAANFVTEAFQEVEFEPSCEGELQFDKARKVAILVLAIAASLINDQCICSIPSRIFTYAVPFLGRISYSIRDVISQDNLFAYLSHWSSFMHSPIAEIFRHEEHQFSIMGDIPNDKDKEIMKKVDPLRQISYGDSMNLHLDSFWNPRNTMSVPEYQQRLAFMQKEETKAISLVLRTVGDTWPLIKLGRTDEVRRTLRSCKEELTTISADSNGLSDFASQYIGVIGLVGKAWGQVFFSNGRIGCLGLLLENLDTRLRRMRYGFLGFNLEQELHVLDFILLTYLLKLSTPGICCRRTTLKRLRSTISCVELETGFTKQVKSLCQEENPFDTKRLLQLFSVKQVVFSEKLKHVKAEMEVLGNDSENPLPFVSGLPAGITFNITVHNVCSEDKLWLKMSVEEEMIQYVFLDLNQFDQDDCVRNLTLSLPFYKTPKAASFSLRACVGKECPVEDVRSLGGPKRELTWLCDDKEVFFVSRS